MTFFASHLFNFWGSKILQSKQYFQIEPNAHITGIET